MKARHYIAPCWLISMITCCWFTNAALSCLRHSTCCFVYIFMIFLAREFKIELWTASDNGEKIIEHFNWTQPVFNVSLSVYYSWAIKLNSLELAGTESSGPVSTYSQKSLVITYSSRVDNSNVEYDISTFIPNEFPSQPTIEKFIQFEGQTRGYNYTVYKIPVSGEY